MEPSDIDGYFVYHNPGTIVQVNIPPDKVEDFHVVTAVFDSAAERISGFHAQDWAVGGMKRRLQRLSQQPLSIETRRCHAG